MTADTAYSVVEMLRRKAPEYLDLITAQTTEQFEKAFDALLEKSLCVLEADKTSFRNLDENALSGILAGALSMPGLTVLREAHSNGHVDLTITADHCVPARKKLGEAKIWNGTQYHVEGLKQLLNRYTTGREGRGLLIEYVKKKNINGLFDNLQEVMNRERPCNQTADTAAHTLRWCFLSTHAHSSGEDLEVGHIGCNLFTDPTLESEN